jgi:catalase (peroxidase I)
MTDIDAVTKELTELITSKGCGPILIRLAWHDAGTYDASTQTGGPRGCMRFSEEKSEANFGANAGLGVARDLLEPIKSGVAKDMSYADLWALAAGVAVKVMGGPDIPFRAGRKDADTVDASVEEGRHPAADQGCPHLRSVFGRMGMTDRDIVALSGAHTVGSCHADRSGFEGPWTADPLKFDNAYFKDLLEKEWIPTTSSKGNPQLKDGPDGKLMMLLTDVAMLSDDVMKPIVEEYAKDEQVFFDDFAKAFQKLLELGVAF